MTEVYFPDDVFNIIKQYADIDPLKHRQKKLKELNTALIKFKKMGRSNFDLEEAMLVKSKLEEYGDEFKNGHEDFQEGWINFFNETYLKEGGQIEYCLDPIIFRNYETYETDEEWDEEWDIDLDWKYALGDYSTYLLEPS